MSPLRSRSLRSAVAAIAAAGAVAALAACESDTVTADSVVPAAANLAPEPSDHATVEPEMPKPAKASPTTTPNPANAAPDEQNDRPAPEPPELPRVSAAPAKIRVTPGPTGKPSCNALQVSLVEEAEDRHQQAVQELRVSRQLAKIALVRLEKLKLKDNQELARQVEQRLTHYRRSAADAEYAIRVSDRTVKQVRLECNP